VLLRETELAEIIGQLPGINPMDPAMANSKGQEQLFICACGFEDRALAIPSHLAESGNYKVEHSLILDHITNKDDNAVNRPELAGFLSRISDDQPKELLYKNEDFAARFQSVLDSVLSGDDKEETPCVSFDISACSSKMVLSALRMLFERNVRLRILYTEASIYHPTIEELQRSPQNWTVDGRGMSRGILTVEQSPLYSGINLDELPILLVAFPTFKPERMRTIISALQPAQTIWIIGIPHAPENNWRMQSMRDINLVSSSERSYELPTFSYVETFAMLEQLYCDQVDNYHMAVAPHGSKLQNIGISLFCLLRRDVELWFSTPESFNPTQYTAGVKDFWQIVFDNTQQVVNLVQSYGKLQLRRS